jgi:Kef-type K+ transport system membrane component KefB
MDRLFEFLIIGVAVSAVAPLMRYLDRLPSTKRRLMIIALSSACWAGIALSFAILAFAIREGDSRTSIKVAAGLGVFLVCSLVSVRSFLRLRKLSAAN